MLHPTVYNTSQFCYQFGVRHAVLSPGSRNAPLTISFARNENIRKWVIPDERTAGFIALGIAQASGEPVVLCCTSGSALLNYGPAIAEAYYREIPLIVLSADRPPNLIDQRDGQTIRQEGALSNHVKGTYALPIIQSEKDVLMYESNLQEGLAMSRQLPLGPVHINIPFDEPFYPDKDQKLIFEKKGLLESARTITQKPLPIAAEGKVVLILGQMSHDAYLSRFLMDLATQIVVLSAPLANTSVGIANYDNFIDSQHGLKPDYLITAGLSVLSKKTKRWIRRNKPQNHWHIDPAGVAVDTFQTEPTLLMAPVLEQLKAIKFLDLDREFLLRWNQLSEQATAAVADWCKVAPYSETTATNQVLKQLPQDISLHFSNSMPVRYAELLGVRPGIPVYCNRGTSGIDGCTSTSVGTALISNEIQVLITGDLAFLYDRNAFFHNHLPNNLRIIILNNQGGGIFRLIDGPSQLPELETYFETRHQRTASYICAENKLGYTEIHNPEELEKQLPDFLSKDGRSRILEIFTDPQVNQKEYKELKSFIDERINN